MEEPCFRVISGRLISNFRPILDEEAKQLLIPSKNKVLSYSTQTGLINHVLGDDSSADQIIAVQQHPTERDQITTVTCRGKIESWDLKKNKCTFSSDISLKEQKRINSAGVFNYKDGEKGYKTFLFFTLGTKNIPNFYFKEIHESSSEPASKKLKTEVPEHGLLKIFSRHTPEILHTSFSSSGNFVSFCQGKQMSGCRLPPKNIGPNHLSEVPFTCIASHPRDEVVATGNELGQICIWSNFIEGSRPTKSLHHWHSNPLTDLCFSSHGTTLYSGGQEAVVVAWELATGQKQLFPRIGAPIKFMINDRHNRILVITKTDNSIDILRTDFSKRSDKITTVNEAVKSTDRNRQISYLKYLDSLVIMGRPGHLQFIDVNGKKSVKNFDVVGRNLFPEDETLMSNPEIWRFCASPNGNLLVTDEGRDDGINLMEEKLKFWHFDESENTYVVNTLINHPHDTKTDSITISPDSKTVVTTSEDGEFKIWTFRTETKSWMCNHTSASSNHSIPTKVCFASDSSLMAVLSGNQIKFYGISDGNFGFRDINLRGDSNFNQVSGMCFGHGKNSRLFVEVRGNLITIWDLFLQTVFWRYENYAEIINLTIDTNSNQMTCFSADNSLLMFSFDMKDPKKVSTEKLGSGKDWNIKPFVVPKCNRRSKNCIVLFTSDYELIFLDQETGCDIGKDNTAIESAGTRLFGQVVSGESKVVPVIHPQKVVPQFNVDRLVDQMFLKNPSHTLPLIEQLCSSFMTCLISGTNIKVEDESE